MTYREMEEERINDRFYNDYNSDSGYYTCRICGEEYIDQKVDFHPRVNEWGFNDVCLDCLGKAEGIDDALTELGYDEDYDKDEFIFENAQDIADYLF